MDTHHCHVFAGVRARQEKVPFVTCDDQELLDGVARPLLNKTVALSAGSSVRVGLVLVVAVSMLQRGCSGYMEEGGMSYVACAACCPCTSVWKRTCFLDLFAP